MISVSVVLSALTLSAVSPLGLEGGSAVGA